MRWAAGMLPLIFGLLAGCQALSLRAPVTELKVQSDPHLYTVTVVKLTVSRADGERLAHAPGTHLAEVLRHRTTDVKQFDPVHLQPGNTEVMDQQKEFRYRAPADTDDEAQGLSTERVGDRIEATLEIPDKSDPLLSIRICDRRMTGWQTLQHGETELRQPRFEQDIIQASTHAALGEWIILGNSGTRPAGETLFLARLDRPRKGLVELETTSNLVEGP